MLDLITFKIMAAWSVTFKNVKCEDKLYHVKKSAVM